MAMSRRKQPHPKSKKDCDETIFVLPDELKCDEESHDIIARSDIQPGHRFGPFPALSLISQSTRSSSDSDINNATSTTSISQIDQPTKDCHQQRSFQLLDTKHNWLARCSISTGLSANLNVIVQDEQIFLVASELISIGKRISTNLIIQPKFNPTEDSLLKSENKMNSSISTEFVQVKNEPVESDHLSSTNSQSMSNIKLQSPTSSPSNRNSKTKEIKKTHPLIFTCEDCGIRFSNRSTLEAHRQHYCTKRETTSSSLITPPTTKNQSTDATVPSKIKSIKRKHIDNNDSTVSPNKRLSLSSTDTYCNECDILFSKPENLVQHKLHYCGTKTTNNHSTITTTSNPISSSSHRQQQQIIEQNLANGFRTPIPFDRPIQIGQFIYVPVPIVPSPMDQSLISSNVDIENENQINKPLDLSKPKKTTDESDLNRSKSNSPLDLTVEKTTHPIPFLNATTLKSTNIVLPQIYECDYCSIRFSSLKTLHAHQENYCVEYRKQKKNTNLNSQLNSTTTNELKLSNIESNSSQSPSLSTSNILSKSLSISPSDISNSSHIPAHRSSPFMCRLCKYRGNTLRGMRMHFKFHLSNNEPCSDDDIIITSTLNQTTNLFSSTIAATQLLLKCTICSAMFDHEETLFNHIRCVHTKENLLECLECQSRFCSKWNLLRHMKLTHTNIKCDDEEEEEEEEDEEEVEVEIEEEQEQEQDIEIDDNDERLKTCDDQNQDHDEPMNVNNSPLNSNRSSPKETSDEDQDLNTSKDKLSDPVNLTRHVLIESMDINSSKNLLNTIALKKKFACPYCHIKFGSIDTLKQHMTNYCSSRPTNDDLNHSAKTVSFNSPTNDNYCSSCQIPFRHKSSYEAHKMYYCRASQKSHVKMQA